MKRIHLGASLISIVAGFIGCSDPMNEPEGTPTADLSDGVQSAMVDGHGPSSILVFLKDSADLAPSERLATKAERVAAVHTTLVEHAAATQAPLLQWLGQQGAISRSFHIVNAVL